MNQHHATILSMLPPWVGIAVGHVVDNASISNFASIASIVYCVVGVYVMLRRNRDD
jgi:threonine/homoserine efflux transporter RhtA